MRLLRGKTFSPRAGRFYGTAAVFILSAAVFAFIGFQRSFADPDSFYHMKMAMLVRERGAVTTFPWLPFTTLGAAFADHHFLYHLLLVPFFAVWGPFVGIKAATVTFAAAAIAVFYRLLLWLRLRFAFFYALILMTSSGFIFRLNLAKTSAASIAVLLAAVIAIQKRRPLPLFVLSFLYVWLYGGWPVLGIVALLWLGAASLVGRLFDGGEASAGSAKPARAFFRAAAGVPHDLLSGDNGRILSAIFAGFGAGLVVNPFFPANLKFYREQIVEIAVVGYRNVIGVGAEWYPMSFQDILGGSNAVFLFLFVALALLLAGLFWDEILLREPPASREDAVSLMQAFALAAFFLFMTLRSQRHVEYFVPFAVIFAARFFETVFSRIDWPCLRARLTSVFWGSRLPQLALAGYLALAFPFLAVRNVIGVRKSYDDNGIPWTKYARSAGWLAANAPKGELIFHSDWDDFPLLFFYNDDNAYVSGLDPTFFYRRDPVRYRQWVNITTGKRKSGAADVIAGSFGARFVFVGNDHEDMRRVIEADPAFQPVYQDDEARIYYRDLCQTPFLLQSYRRGCKIVKAPPLILRINIVAFPIFRQAAVKFRDESDFGRGLYKL